MCGCGKVEGQRLPNKFRAEKSTYNGYTYDSQKEGRYAADLDKLVRAHEILAWDRQFPVEVCAEGKHIFTTKVDFRLHMKDGSFELHEVKGWITARQPDYRLKKKCIELFWLPKHPEYTYVVVD